MKDVPQLLRIHFRSREDVLKGHFYNPVYDWGLYKENNDVIEEIGQSLISRANDDRIREDGMPFNEWS